MIDEIIEAYVDSYPEELSIALLQTLAYPGEQGGRGYGIELLNLRFDMDGWEVDTSRRMIQIDIRSTFGAYDKYEMAEALKYAIETEFVGTRATMLSRVGWGTGKVVLGVVETVVGVIGVVVPEPGTTVGGVVMVGLGVNSIGDGVSQLFGANQGHGVNILSEGFGMVGAGVADLANINPEVGRTVGQGVFLVSSIAAGSFASIKILRAPGRVTFARGVGGQPGGFQLGRIDMLYGSTRAGDGMTILSITNNTNQSILRFVTHSGKLVVNGRIVGVSRIMVHETNAKNILKGLLKLLAHGAKF